ncbi:hypothetical protein NDU88_000885 [Pleurodeles waltl]|uniref:Uncharacterized protein n=1 Tax=Pleurodeles waltl TaxID=8319 RepID=A0AAV7ND96_PLEWA|nr:hypothetical protein NDU88_000883 [Pleurodeles waltl]KAJ1112624.1 hypothetical protein NDU88_000885 [Pleurodeles waltl]
MNVSLPQYEVRTWQHGWCAPGGLHQWKPEMLKGGEDARAEDNRVPTTEPKSQMQPTPEDAKGVSGEGQVREKHLERSVGVKGALVLTAAVLARGHGHKHRDFYPLINFSGPAIFLNNRRYNTEGERFPGKEHLKIKNKDHAFDFL